MIGPPCTLGLNGGALLIVAFCFCSGSLSNLEQTYPGPEISTSSCHPASSSIMPGYSHPFLPFQVHSPTPGLSCYSFYLFLKICFIVLMIVDGGHGMSPPVRRLQKPKAGIRCPGVGITDGCEMPDAGARNQTQVFCKPCRSLLSHLSDPNFNPFIVTELACLWTEG